MSAFHALMAELKAAGCRDLIQKCIGSGALTPEKAKQVEARLNACAAEDIALAKAIPPGPTLPEIVKGGFFSELKPAPL